MTESVGPRKRSDAELSGRTRSRGRAVAAAAMIVVAALLAPVAVVCGWASWMLTDTDRFVATYAPLAESPEVQTYVVDQTMAAISTQVDLDQLADQVVEGIIALGTGPRATTALRTLKGSLVTSLRSQIRTGVADFVTSDRFGAAWSQSLRIAHRQVMGSLRGDPQAIAQIGPDGTIGIPLGPIVEQAKARLVDQGLTIANRIPEVDRTVVLIRSDQLPRAQTAYALVVGLGTWLPWVVLALLVGGVAVADRRRRALVQGALGLAVALVVLLIAIAIGRVVLLGSVPATVLPGSVAGLLYDTATDRMRSTAAVGIALAAVVALVAWLIGPVRTRRVRHEASQAPLT